MRKLNKASLKVAFQEWAYSEWRTREYSRPPLRKGLLLKLDTGETVKGYLSSAYLYFDHSGCFLDARKVIAWAIDSEGSNEADR